MEDVTYQEMVLTYYEHYYYNNPEQMQKDNVELNSDKEKEWFEFAKKKAEQGIDPFECEKEFDELYKKGIRFTDKDKSVASDNNKILKPKFDDRIEVDDSLFEQFSANIDGRTL